MWRWWMFAGLVVMALGVVTMGVMAVYSGGSRPCLVNQVSEEFHKGYTTRLDMDFGETALLTMTMRNTQEGRQGFDAGFIPPVLFTVLTPDCRTVWQSPHSFLAPIKHIRFEPHEAKRFGGEWSLTDDWGELVPPGYYHVYGVMQVDGDPTDRNEHIDAQLAVRKTVWVGSAQLQTVRPRHPPTPAHPCINGGGLVYEAYVRQVMEEHSELLVEWERWAFKVLEADLLNENRVSTGRRGIRVVEHVPPWAPPWEDSPFEKLPECLEGVPVQVVVRPDE